MAKSIINKEKTKLWNTVVKTKKLQKMGDALCIVIPKSWIETLNWNRDTLLCMEISPLNNKITIHEKISDIKPKSD